MSRSHPLKQPVEVGEYLIRHPKFYHGELTFRGTRIPVRTVLRYLAKGYSVDWAMEAWPGLSREAILEAIAIAVEALEEKFQEAA